MMDVRYYIAGEELISIYNSVPPDIDESVMYEDQSTTPSKTPLLHFKVLNRNFIIHRYPHDSTKMICEVVLGAQNTNTQTWITKFIENKRSEELESIIQRK